MRAGISKRMHGVSCHRFYVFFYLSKSCIDFVALLCCGLMRLLLCSPLFLCVGVVSLMFVSPPLRVHEDVWLPYRGPSLGVEPQRGQEGHFRQDHPAGQREEVIFSSWAFDGKSLASRAFEKPAIFETDAPMARPRLGLFFSRSDGGDEARWCESRHRGPIHRPRKTRRAGGWESA